VAEGGAVKHASLDFETDEYYEGGEYGHRVPDDLWERYEIAREALRMIGREIAACPVDARPLPPPGTLGRHMYDMYMKQLKDQVEHVAAMNRFKR
jgi:hypothetical protein